MENNSRSVIYCPFQFFCLNHSFLRQVLMSNRKGENQYPLSIDSGGLAASHWSGLIETYDVSVKLVWKVLRPKVPLYDCHGIRQRWKGRNSSSHISENICDRGWDSVSRIWPHPECKFIQTLRSAVPINTSSLSRCYVTFLMVAWFLNPENATL